MDINKIVTHNKNTINILSLITSYLFIVKIHYDTTMASRTHFAELNLANPDDAEAWIRQLAATARNKGITDVEATEDTTAKFGITDLFISHAGLESIKRLSLMAAPQELENMKFLEIKQLILNTIRPKKKLVIAERTKFLSIKQESSENIIDYYQRLRDAAKFCDFGNLGNNMPKEDELIIMRLIGGLFIPDQQSRILQLMQGTDMNLEQILSSLQQWNQIQNYTESQYKLQSDQSTTSIHAAKTQEKDRIIHNCSFCGGTHTRGRCPAFGKTCKKCGKVNHFEMVCRSKKIHFSNLKNNKIEEHGKAPEYDNVFNLFSVTGKGTFKSVSIDGQHGIKMQVDTGADVSIIPRNFWEKLGRPQLRKSTKTLRNYDNSTMKIMGNFSACIECESRFCVVDLVVVDVEKGFGLLGSDFLNIETMNIHTTAAHNFGCLEGYAAKIKLIENAKPSFCESRSLPIHIKPLVITEIKRMEREGILEVVPEGGSEWASPIVAIRKPNGSIRVCADYKVGVNSKICNDYFPLPQVETAFANMAGMSWFAKIDLSNAYFQIIIIL